MSNRFSIDPSAKTLDLVFIFSDFFFLPISSVHFVIQLSFVLTSFCIPIGGKQIQMQIELNWHHTDISALKIKHLYHIPLENVLLERRHHIKVNMFFFVPFLFLFAVTVGNKSVRKKTLAWKVKKFVEEKIKEKKL